MKRLTLALLVTACGTNGRPPEGVMDRDRFTQALVGATLIEARLQQEMARAPADSPPMRAYYDELFAGLGADSALFRKSFDHYTEHPLEMKAIYEEVVERLRVMRDEGLQGNALANDTALATDSSSERNR